MTILHEIGGVFQQVVSMSLTASLVILAICAARLLLRQAPKKFSYWLWAGAAFRLVCPFSFPAAFSLLALAPAAQTVAETGPLTEVSYLPGAGLPEAAPGVGAADAALPQVAGTGQALGLWEVLGLVWLLGAVALVVGALVAYLRVKGQVATAVKFAHNVYECGAFRSPFVLGFFRPKIYIPFGLEPRQREHVLCHESAHIQRRDYLIKTLGFLLLAIHWFNPLVWLAFHLMSRDMEMSCDEKVLAQLGEEARREYSLSLLSIGSRRRFPAPNPLAFGETGVKERVVNVMKFRRAKRWVTVAAAVAVVAVTAACAANPAGESLLPSASPASSGDSGGAGDTSSATLATGVEDEVDQHLLEVLTTWLDQPDQELLSRYEAARQSLRPITMGDGAAASAAESSPEADAGPSQVGESSLASGKSSDPSAAAQAELDAYLQEAFPPEYFTERGYEAFTSTMMQSYFFHLFVGDGTMKLARLEPNETEPENSSWQWVATARVSRPGEEEQDIPLRVSVQEEGDKIASLRLYREDVTQVYAYFGSDPFLAMESAAQEQQAELEAEMQDAFDNMQSLQEEIDRLEAEQAEGAAVSSQLEEAQSQWQAEFDRYGDALGQAYEDGDTAESSAVSQPEATPPPAASQSGAETATEPPQAAAARLGTAHYQWIRDNVGLPVLDFYTETKVREISEAGDAMIIGATDYFLPREEDKSLWIIGNTKELDGDQEGWLRNTCTIEARLVDGVWTAMDYSTGILSLA